MRAKGQNAHIPPGPEAQKTEEEMADLYMNSMGRCGERRGGFHREENKTKSPGLQHQLAMLQIQNVTAGEFPHLPDK